jgi:hypothetical protein
MAEVGRKARYILANEINNRKIGSECSKASPLPGSPTAIDGWFAIFTSPAEMKTETARFQEAGRFQ